MKLSEIAKEILSQSYNVTDQAGEELHVVDMQDIMDILSRLASNGLLSDVSNSEKLKIPAWWNEYKRANPDDKDDYNPEIHCCSRFWKDWCNCMR